MLYIRTIDDTGRPILTEVLQQVVAIVSSAVPQYTNGRFGVAGIEQGTETRRGQPGWLTIEWTRDASEFCGRANVGQEGGGITLTYDQPGCSCGSQKIRPRTVKHEFGHAMGLWHTGQSVDLMSGIGVSECGPQHDGAGAAISRLPLPPPCRKYRSRQRPVLGRAYATDPGDQLAELD